MSAAHRKGPIGAPVAGANESIRIRLLTMMAGNRAMHTTANPVGWKMIVVDTASVDVTNSIRHPLANTRRIKHRIAALLAVLMAPAASLPTRPNV
jgi:hypothetical protein